MASKSLGPFPKQRRWFDIARDLGIGRPRADELLHLLKHRYALMTADPSAWRAITMLVALPVATRFPSPETCLEREFQIHTSGPKAVELLRAMELFLPGEHVAKLSLRDVIHEVSSANTGTDRLFEDSDWSVWRYYDGLAFCDLALLYFSNLNQRCFNEVLGESESVPAREHVEKFAWEASLITRSFSARWFNACARTEIPESGSIQWYWGHCLGKLDLELSPELSDWEEPTGNPWKRRKRANPRLPL